MLMRFKLIVNFSKVFSSDPLILKFRSMKYRLVIVEDDRNEDDIRGML